MKGIASSRTSKGKGLETEKFWDIWEIKSDWSGLEHGGACELLKLRGQQGPDHELCYEPSWALSHGPLQTEITASFRRCT